MAWKLYLLSNIGHFGYLLATLEIQSVASIAMYGNGILTITTGARLSRWTVYQHYEVPSVDVWRPTSWHGESLFRFAMTFDQFFQLWLDKNRIPDIFFLDLVISHLWFYIYIILYIYISTRFYWLWLVDPPCPFSAGEPYKTMQRQQATSESSNRDQGQRSRTHFGEDGIMAIVNQPPPGHVPPPPRNMGLIAGLIKGNQWSISP